MRSGHRLPQRLVRGISVSVSLALILSALSSVPVQSAGSKQPIRVAPGRTQSQDGKGTKVEPVPPKPGAPAIMLPNLDEARQRRADVPQAVPPITSTMRSPRKPLESRRGRKVGDPLPRPKQRASNESGSSAQVSMASAGVKRESPTVRSHHARLSPARAVVSMLPMPQSGGGVTNLALNRPTTQSSIGWGGGSSRGVDGNTDGNWANNSVTHTLADNQAWWQVDLGAMRSIQSVEVWNRTDCCAERLTNFKVLLLDSNQAVVSSVTVTGQGGTPTSVSLSGAARYVKVQLVGSDYLSLAEVKVWGTLNSTSEQYVENFFWSALARPPSGDEAGYWNDIERAAYLNGQGSMNMAVREIARSVFESAEYVARGRSNHWYVYDLYESYLKRDPDAAGWAFWESCVPSMGREQVRRAFDDCAEFSNIVSTLTASGAPSSGAASLTTNLVDPFNETGNQVLARDAEWSVPLLSLPGRAGLDLGLGLSYSSLVWTRVGPYVYWDEDHGSPSPGFHLGFPTIKEKSFDARVGRNVYVLVTAAGRRVELRQVGTSTLYESADSSYLQLFDYGSSIWIRTTDGTQMGFGPTDNDWTCALVKDRNGNLISVGYNGQGDILNVTDTLGRVINFNYDGNANLSSITENGRSQPWATFGWGPVPLSFNFGSLSVVGAYNGDAVTQVSLDDGSHYNFEYAGTGQVNMIRRYTSDNVERSHTAYTYEGTDDCPRLTQQRVWAENWSGLYGVPNEVVTTFGVASDGARQVTSPDGTIYKEFYGGAGWQRGLTVQTQVLSAGLQKTTNTTWAQDANTSENYPTNPRVIQTTVDDAAGNHRSTSIDYGQYAQYGLPYLVTEYANNNSTPLRQTYTDYNLSQPYLNWHLIGLVSLTRVWDPASSQWVSKTTYGYDDPALIESQATTATQHDQSWNTSFLVRGNLTSVSRWDVTDINNSAKALTNQMQYDAAGSVTLARDPLNHVTALHYGDWFTDGDHNTFAYASTVTDPDGNNSSTQFNYLFGDRTRVQGPAPQGQTQGVIQTFAYDTARRLELVTTLNNGAYVRYLYQGNAVHQYSAVNNIADEAYSAKFFDGAGHLIFDEGNFPGSAGGYRAVYTIYDAMGRAVKQSNPTEITAVAVPTGDDATGWVYTQQSYDWKGRPLVTTNPDNTHKEASYSACGCAGNEVVTLTDEMERQQRVYSDSLGRQWKTEVLNDNGGVYSTTTNIYNARDQVTAVNTYSGSATSDLSCPAGTCLQSVTTYDGYGRLATQRLPQQTAATAYEYNGDDTVHKVTDPRGVAATNTYNNRHLLTGISYAPAAGIDAPAPVSFGYDAVGNRTSMADGTGSIGYSYNQLSRLTSESRYFNELGNSFTIGYGYNLAGELSSITDPSGAQVSYNYDQTGRLTSMPASGYSGVTNFLANAQYRASGAMKHATYGNSVQVDLNYNSRLQISQYQVSGFQSPFGTMGATMSYYDDGRTNTAYDLSDARFDRKYEFDFAARLKEAYTGPEAHGQPAPPTPQANSPYRQSYTYDQWNNVTLRTGRIWSTQNEYDQATYGSDNKRQGFGYDAAGNVTWTGNTDGARTYDAADRPATFTSSQTWQVYPNWPSGHPDAPALETQDTFDGTGQVAKHVNHTRHDDTYDSGGGNLVYTMSDTTNTTYYVHSTVLGGKTIAEFDQFGVKTKGYAYAGGARVATQMVVGGSNAVQIESTNPVTGAAIVTDVNGNSATRQEPDPLGRELAQAPDPTVAVDPLFSSKWNEPMPIEAMGGPSEEYLNNNAARADEMDLLNLESAVKNRFKATVQTILEKNPNIGVKTSNGRSLYGSNAAQYLNSLSTTNGPDTSSNDGDDHDITSAYHVNIVGGVELFGEPAQKRITMGSARVYLWNPSGSGSKAQMGHMSARFENGVYVSFWPRERVGAGAPAVAADWGWAATFHSYEDDLDSGIGEGRPPDDSFLVNNLNLDAVSAWYKELYKNPGTWHISRNCADLIAQALTVGGLVLDNTQRGSSLPRDVAYIITRDSRRYPRGRSGAPTWQSNYQHITDARWP